MDYDMSLAGPGCDIYSLGAMFWSLMTGLIPFDGLSVDDIENGHYKGACSRKMNTKVVIPHR